MAPLFCGYLVTSGWIKCWAGIPGYFLSPLFSRSEWLVYPFIIRMVERVSLFHLYILVAPYLVPNLICKVPCYLFSFSYFSVWVVFDISAALKLFT